MNDSIEAAAREALLEADKEIACLLHPEVTVLHFARNPCPLCKPGPDPEAIVKAVHALATAPAPFSEVLEAVRAIEPIIRQLGEGKGITALGHSVADVVRLGEASGKLEGWLNGKFGDRSYHVRVLFDSLPDADRKEIAGDCCGRCFRLTKSADGTRFECDCRSEE